MKYQNSLQLKTGRNRKLIFCDNFICHFVLDDEPLFQRIAYNKIIYILYRVSFGCSGCWDISFRLGCSWWRHLMESFSALLAFCAGNSPVTGEFPTQMPVTRGFDVFFDLRPNKRSSKQSRGWWFDTQSRPLWRHYNVTVDLSLEPVI